MKPLSVKILLIVCVLGVISFEPFSDPRRAQAHPILSPQVIGQSWYELSPKERSRAWENYQRFQKLPPDQQRKIEEKYHQWQKLPSEEQERIRRNYDRYRGMNPTQRQDFQRKFKKWSSQPR